MTGSQQKAFGAVQACFAAAGIKTKDAIDRMQYCIADTIWRAKVIERLEVSLRRRMNKLMN